MLAARGTPSRTELTDQPKQKIKRNAPNPRTSQLQILNLYSLLYLIKNVMNKVDNTPHKKKSNSIPVNTIVLSFKD